MNLFKVLAAALVVTRVAAAECAGTDVLVVHGKDGMDEVSLGAATLVGELKALGVT